MEITRGEISYLLNMMVGYGYGDGDGDGAGDGYGTGYGDGNGASYGYGYGDGDGYGDGYGYGTGYGYGGGYGYGYGYGYGTGYGTGYGYGYGYGYGGGGCDGGGYGDGASYGYGDGYGDGAYINWSILLRQAIKNWPLAQQERFIELQEEDCILALWKSDENGFPANGGNNKQDTKSGDIEEIAGPLHICTRNALHATMQPEKWNGSRLWVVALFGEIQQQDDKYGALKREIIGEITFFPVGK